MTRSRWRPNPRLSVECALGLRTLHSYDKPGITADYVTWARQILDAHGGKDSKSIEAALPTISRHDSNLPQQVVELFRWRLTVAYTREAKQRADVGRSAW